MMNFSTDLNLLAANNVIGYDTYANTLNGMGMRAGGYNPYGVGKINTGLGHDTFNKSSAASKIGGGIVGACVALIGARVLGETKIATKGKGNKKTVWQSIQKGLGFKTAAKRTPKAANTAKTAKSGIKSILSKIGKGCKIAAITAGVSAVAVEGLRIYKTIKLKHMPLDATGCPQEGGYVPANNQETA
ncbi:hypothetical protein IJ732_03800 [bacterium]|nr:hypothetical protein [bacterium]